MVCVCMCVCVRVSIPAHTPAGSSDVYRWDGARFLPYLILPPTNARVVD